jgi:hypothetical protein
MAEFEPFTSPALEAFVRVVEEYCALIDARETLSPSDLLVAAHDVLARLYAAGLSLPSTEVLSEDDIENQESDETREGESREDSDRIEHEEWRKLYRALDEKLGSWSVYREIFDPYDWSCEEEVAGCLAEDLADIYTDLREGLLKWQRGDTGTALWEWRFDLEHHWGAHVTGPLRALFALASNREIPWPASEEKTP